MIVDDESNLRRMLRSVLEVEGYSVIEAGSAEAGLTLLEEHHPEVVLLDLALPGASGLEILPRYRERSPGTPVIMMSGEATLSDAVQATRDGAFHFLEKPLTPEGVLVTLRGAIEVSRAHALTRTLQVELGAGTPLVGTSGGMEVVREFIRKVAPTDSRVLIVGESGTGKELAATAIHELSARRGGPFVRVNSAAIPRELVESEMFGHERGAFTGAEARRRGRFELAHRGTLFLDEVGDLQAEAQGKLLRVLETGVIERVGGNDPIEVDVRVLAATNRDLRTEVREGRFREDLLFRLEVLPIRMPPLRERPEDIAPLVAHLAERLRVRQGLVAPSFSEEALRMLEAHAWPGNVRELLNLIERLSILRPGGPVHPSDLRAFLNFSPAPGSGPAYRDSDERSLGDRLKGYEADLIRGALEASDQNVAEAARRLRTDRANLHRRIRRLGLGGDA
jgi:two-component system, NtrC family, nitrogen regulation response regulator NtrX